MEVVEDDDALGDTSLVYQSALNSSPRVGRRVQMHLSCPTAKQMSGPT